MSTDNDWGKKLDDLWVAFRNAHPDPEPDANFMPRLWQKIDARRHYALCFRRIARGFLTASIAICMLIGMFLLSPIPPTSAFNNSSYVDVLDEDQDMLAYADSLEDADDPQFQ